MISLTEQQLRLNPYNFLPLACEAPRASHGRRAIEADFPILEVSRLAQLESYRKNIYRPAYYIHKWWSGRLGSESDAR